jgi:NAD(P)-dependent dehydrogenase (short-subunit alcohol dehydrogenase family)
MGGSGGRTACLSSFLVMTSILDIKDRVIVVIGSTSGLGLALAKGFATHGADCHPRLEDANSELSAICRELDPDGNRNVVPHGRCARSSVH